MKPKAKHRHAPKQWGAVLEPGDIEGRRGELIQRDYLNGYVWHIHRENKEYRCKVVGEELWPLKEGEEVDPASVTIFRREEIVGRELVSKMTHWWMDKEIRRPRVRNEDWTMTQYFDDHPSEDWQLPWCLEYECWREWQPWSDFDRWRKAFQQEVKRMRTSNGLSQTQSEERAAVLGDFRLPLWLLRDCAEFLPRTPWIAIPSKDREELLAKTGIKQGSCYDSPPSLEGSVQALKRRPPNAKTWVPGSDEALRAHSEWLEAPGHYNAERVDEHTSGWFSGTYVIHVKWYYPDHVLRKSFDKWLAKHRPPQQQDKLSVHGENKHRSWLRELGALRLLRKMLPDQAISYTRQVLRDEAGAAYPLFVDGPRMERAAEMADQRLASRWGISSRTE